MIDFRNDPSVARSYDDLTSHASDNEYLHYINHKLGYANTLLLRLTQTVQVFGVAVVTLLAIVHWDELRAFWQ